jgi:AcrR family transcriptional regulator
VNTPPFPRSPKRPGTRERIVAGARDTFFASGYDGASMAEIAAKAGVSKGTLYTHFGDKSELFAEVVQSKCEEIRSRHFVFDPATPLPAVLYQLGCGLIGAFLSNDVRSVYRTVVSEAHRTPRLGQAFLQAGPEPGAKSLAALLDAAVERHELAIPDTQLAAYQFVHLCDAGLSERAHLGDGIPTDAEIDRHVRSAIDVFLRGYAR